MAGQTLKFKAIDPSCVLDMHPLTSEYREQRVLSSARRDRRPSAGLVVDSSELYPSGSMIVLDIAFTEEFSYRSRGMVSWVIPAEAPESSHKIGVVIFGMQKLDPDGFPVVDEPSVPPAPMAEEELFEADAEPDEAPGTFEDDTIDESNVVESAAPSIPPASISQMPVTRTVPPPYESASPSSSQPPTQGLTVPLPQFEDFLRAESEAIEPSENQENNPESSVESEPPPPMGVESEPPIDELFADLDTIMPPLDLDSDDPIAEMHAHLEDKGVMPLAPTEPPDSPIAPPKLDSRIPSAPFIERDDSEVLASIPVGPTESSVENAENEDNQGQTSELAKMIRPPMPMSLHDWIGDTEPPAAISAMETPENAPSDEDPWLANTEPPPGIFDGLSTGIFDEKDPTPEAEEGDTDEEVDTKVSTAAGELVSLCSLPLKMANWSRSSFPLPENEPSDMGEENLEPSSIAPLSESAPDRTFIYKEEEVVLPSSMPPLPVTSRDDEKVDVEVKEDFDGEMALVEAFEQMHGLYKKKDRTAAAEYVLALARKLIACESAVCLLISPRKYELHVAASDPKTNLSWQSRAYHARHGLVGNVIQTGLAVRLYGPDFEPDVEFPTEGFVTKNIIVSPITMDGYVIGAIELRNSPREDGFLREEENVLTYIGTALAEFIQVSLPEAGSKDPKPSFQ